jgi:hypothetical protein
MWWWWWGVWCRYGLCYRSNCYKADYLQVAIQSQLTNRIDWYKCPTKGGKLYIPGYTGAFHCPVAECTCCVVGLVSDCTARAADEDAEPAP